MVPMKVFEFLKENSVFFMEILLAVFLFNVSPISFLRICAVFFIYPRSSKPLVVFVALSLSLLSIYCTESLKSPTATDSKSLDAGLLFPCYNH